MDFGINVDFAVRRGSTHEETFQEAFELVDWPKTWDWIPPGWRGPFLTEPLGTVGSYRGGQCHCGPHHTTQGWHGRPGAALDPPFAHRRGSRDGRPDQSRPFRVGIGRSGNVRAYDIMGIDYAESKERFQEALDIILKAWSGEPFSYEGQYNHITNATLSPLPYHISPLQKIRIAASSGDSFGRIGRLGYPIFLGLRFMDVEDLKTNLRDYREEWMKAGHSGGGRRYQRALPDVHRPE